MTLQKDFLLASALVLVIVACASIIAFTQNVGIGQAVEPNMQSRIHAMSTSSVGVYTASTISAGTIENCASRIVTTNERLYLSFDPSLTPTGVTRGLYQAASTTVAYDAEQYGCGAVTAIAGATTTVSITTFKF